MINQLLEQVQIFWQNLSPFRRFLLISLLGAGVLISLIFVSWASQPNYVVAYSGLAEADAGEIAQKLNEQSISYQLQGGGTIMVPSDQVYEVRLQMAREGLPKGDSVGFELFSGNTLGMTDFTQRINYQQALEGELERTISSLSMIEAVRVHIAIPEKTIFTEDQTPVTASITIMFSPGQTLDNAQIQAIIHLVSGSVESLNADDVVVVDVSGNLLAAGSINGAGTSMMQMDNQRATERSIAAALESNIQRLLDNVLGPNRSVVQASIVLDWTEIETTTQSFDPNAVVQSSDTVTENYTASGDGTGGVPGAETNLPDGVDTQVEGQNNSSYNYAQENITYEISQTQIYEVKVPGKLVKISLSVLVDGVTDPQQLETLRSAIAAAAGIDGARGDTVVVESIIFDRSYYEQQATALSEEQQSDESLQYTLIGGGVLLFFILLWYISRLLKNLQSASVEAWQPLMLPVSQTHENLSQSSSVAQLTKDFGREHDTEDVSGEERLEKLRRLEDLNQPDENDEYFRKMRENLNQLADNNPSSVAEVIQTWLEEGA